MAEEQGFRVASAYVQVSPDTSGFRERLQGDLDEAVAGVEASVKVGADTSEAKAQIDDLKAQLDELRGDTADVKVEADASEAKAEIDEVKAERDELDGSKATLEITAEAGEAKAEIDDVKAKRDEVDGSDATVVITADDAEFQAKMAEVNAEKREASSPVNVPIGGSGGDSGGGGFSFPGGLMGGLALGATALLPGISGAVAGLGLLGGTGLAAFGGIGKALSAHSQASQNVGITQAQQAATAFSNSVAIQQAQQAVGQAYKQSAENAVMSAEQTSSAEGQLAMTVRNAAASQAQALQSVTQAQQQEQSATAALQQAQYNLSNAWIQARYQLQQLRDEYNNSGASIQAAKVALEQAEYQQRLTDANAMSTSLDRAQAAVAATQAQEQLTSAQQNATYVAKEYQLQEKGGVAGSQTVVSAKQAEQQAIYGVKDAVTQMTDAQRNLTNTELNNAQQVKQAQLAVTEAQQQAAYQQEQDALAVSNAQQNVTNTLKSQQLQAAATASTANQAANQFAKDMSRLSAPAREVVRELLSMSGAWRTIERIAQTTIAPGLTIFLQGIKGILPEIDSGVRQMGRAMGEAFGSFGKLMQTPAFKEGFAGLIRNGVQFASTVLPAVATLLEQLGKLGAQKGAVSGIANLLAGIGGGLTNVVKAVSPFTGALSSVFTTLGKALLPLGTQLGRVVGSLGAALAPALKALLPGWNALIGALGTGLSAALTGLVPLMKPLGAAVSIMVEAFAPLLPQTGQVIGQFARGLAPVLTALLPSIRQMAGLLMQNLQVGFMQTLRALLPLIPAIGKLIISLTPVIRLVTDVAGWVMTFAADLTGPLASALVWVVAKVIDFASKWQDAFKIVGAAAMFLWHNVLDPVWQGIASGAENLYQNWIKPYFDLWVGAFHMVENAALWMWHNVLDPVWQGIMTGVRGFESGFSAVWGKLETIFKTPVNFLIGTVYDKGIARFWNDIVGKVGLSSLKLPVIPMLAKGGIVPGRDAGRDNQLVGMRSGEGVLVPEAVQAIGPGTVHALNNKFGGGGSGSGGGLSFAHGGVLGDIGGFFTSIGRGIVSGAEFAKNFATNPVGAVTSLLDKAIGTNATGDLAKVMTAIPKTLVKDLASLVSSGGGGKGSSIPGKGGVPGGAGQHPSGLVASWFAQAVKLAGVSPSWIPDLETIAWYESGDNPNAINLSDSNAAAGDPSRGLMQTIMSTFLAYHQPGTSTNIYNPVANIAAATRYIRSRYGNPADTPGIMSLSHGGGYQGYDSGGWLMPSTMPVNRTGQPEAVLTPEQSQAFVQLAKHLGASGAGAGAAPQANFNYFGTMYPDAEQRALMRRDLAMSLSGGS